MSDGQFRVIMLLGILALLEVAAHPSVKAYMKSVYASLSKGVAK